MKIKMKSDRNNVNHYYCNDELISKEQYELLQNGGSDNQNTDNVELRQGVLPIQLAIIEDSFVKYNIQDDLCIAYVYNEKKRPLDFHNSMQTQLHSLYLTGNNNNIRKFPNPLDYTYIYILYNSSNMENKNHTSNFNIQKERHKEDNINIYIFKNKRKNYTINKYNEKNLIHYAIQIIEEKKPEEKNKFRTKENGEIDYAEPIKEIFFYHLYVNNSDNNNNPKSYLDERDARTIIVNTQNQEIEVKNVQQSVQDTIPEYNMLTEIKASDHRPVYRIFEQEKIGYKTLVVTWNMGNFTKNTNENYISKLFVEIINMANNNNIDLIVFGFQEAYKRQNEINKVFDQYNTKNYTNMRIKKGKSDFYNGQNGGYTNPLSFMNINKILIKTDLIGTFNASSKLWKIDDENKLKEIGSVEERVRTKFIKILKLNPTDSDTKPNYKPLYFLNAHLPFKNTYGKYVNAITKIFEQIRKEIPNNSNIILFGDLNSRSIYDSRQQTLTLNDNLEIKEVQYGTDTTEGNEETTEGNEETTEGNEETTLNPYNLQQNLNKIIQADNNPTSTDSQSKIDVPNEKTKETLLDELYNNDILIRLRADGNINFDEPKGPKGFAFLPSYKFKPGTDQYELFKKKKKYMDV